MCVYISSQIHDRRSNPMSQQAHTPAWDHGPLSRQDMSHSTDYRAACRASYLHIYIGLDVSARLHLRLSDQLK